MQVLIFDTETTGAQRNKGNPFDPRNRLCALAYWFDGLRGVYDIQHGDEPYQHKLDDFQARINASDLVVGFNLKFDIHWGRRYGLTFHSKVWDCQLYHFLQGNQKSRMPSLASVAEAHQVGGKLDVVKTEYWDKGLDTDLVPWDILEEYAMNDVDPVTRQVFEKQYAEFLTLPENRRKLIMLHMRDLLVLEEMEYNGQKYDSKLSRRMGDSLSESIANTDRILRGFAPNVPVSFNSDEQLSVFLYGGVIEEKVQETYVFTYKDPKKAPVEKTRWVVKEHRLPRIFTPLDNTKLQKEGIYSTDKTTLTKLRIKANSFQKKLIDLLLERSKLEQRKSTYCYGTPKVMEEMGWENDTLHGNLNQCVAITGRLSSSKPNLQNQDEKMQICFLTRFPMTESQTKNNSSKSAPMQIRLA